MAFRLPYSMISSNLGLGQLWERQIIAMIFLLVVSDLSSFATHFVVDQSTLANPLGRVIFQAIIN